MTASTTIDPKLLSLLVCPLTHGPLELDADKGELVSREAGLAYPIRNGVPVMLPEEARKLDDPARDGGGVTTDAPWPVELVVRRGARMLDIRFDDGSAFQLPARLLRAMTPSAEAHGHGGPSFQPIAAKPEVALTDAAPVGRYAVRLHFDDGHTSGLYTWERLHRIGRESAALEAAIPG